MKKKNINDRNVNRVVEILRNLQKSKDDEKDRIKNINSDLKPLDLNSDVNKSKETDGSKEVEGLIVSFNNLLVNDPKIINDHHMLFRQKQYFIDIERIKELNDGVSKISSYKFGILLEETEYYYDHRFTHGDYRSLKNFHLCFFLLKLRNDEINYLFSNLCNVYLNELMPNDRILIKIKKETGLTINTIKNFRGYLDSQKIINNLLFLSNVYNNNKTEIDSFIQ